MSPSPWPPGDEALDTRPRLERQSGHGDRIQAVAWSPDGRHVLMGDGRGRVILWDARDGRQLRTLEGPNNAVGALIFDARGRLALVGRQDGGIQVWDLVDGSVRRWQAHQGAVLALALHPSGTRIYSGGQDGSVTLWELKNGQPVWTVAGGPGGDEAVRALAAAPGAPLAVLWGHQARLLDSRKGRLLAFEADVSESYLAFCQDGASLLLGVNRFWDKYAQLWDWRHEALSWTADTADYRMGALTCPRHSPFVVVGDSGSAHVIDVDSGQEVRRVEGLAGGAEQLALSPDASLLLTAGQGGEGTLWRLEDEAELLRLTGHSSPVLAGALGGDGRYLAAGSRDGGVRIWDLHQGGVVQQLDAGSTRITGLVFSPDGERLLGSGFFRRPGQARLDSARLWHWRSGEEVFRSGLRDTLGMGASFSADGALGAVGELSGRFATWDMRGGDMLREWELDEDDSLRALALSPDGRRLVSGNEVGFRVWDTESGALLFHSEAHGGRVRALAFTADGRYLLTGGNDGWTRLWDTGTWRQIQRYGPHGRVVDQVAFTPDPGGVLTAGYDGFAVIWDRDSGEERVRVASMDGGFDFAAVTPDGRWLLAGGYDQTTGIWDAATGELVLRLLAFDNGTWAVVDPQGRFDAPLDRPVPGLYWVVDTAWGPEAIELEQLKSYYWEPGLLPRTLGYSDEPLRPVVPFDGRHLHPAVTWQLQGDALTIHLRERGGGIGRVSIFLNGREIVEDARVFSSRTTREGLRLQVDLSTLDTWHPLPGQDNELRVQAYNASGQLSSRGVGRGFVPALPVTPPAPVNLWAVVAGVSDYAGEELDLRFAAEDANTFARALLRGATELLGSERVHLQLLSTSNDDPTRRVTLDNLARAFQAARQAQPQDIFVVYLAGHGVALDGEFYYPSEQATIRDLQDPALLSADPAGLQTTGDNGLREVSDATAALISAAAPGGGFIFGTCSGLHGEMCPEKVHRMYETADNAGVYPCK